jgi:DNA-binding beta-propeller fold protein YncE
VAVDGSGNVYVSDTRNQRIEKFDSGGTFLAKWGTPYPWLGVAVDGSGNVYVADLGNNRIEKWSLSQ